MPTLAAFHTLVSQEIRKGSAYDAVIPGAVRRAANWLETNYSFRYMETDTTVSLVTAGRSTTLPATIKAIRYLYRVDDDGNIVHTLRAVTRDWTVRGEEGPPEAYWTVGDTIWYDTVADQNYTLNLGYYAYTNWDGLAGSASPWLTTRGENLLLAQTMLELIPQLRQPGLLALYQPRRDEALRAALNADQEASEATQDMVMGYGHGPV